MNWHYDGLVFLNINVIEGLDYDLELCCSCIYEY